MRDEEILKENGWEIECFSPYEIRKEDGSFASGDAVYSVIHELRFLETREKIMFYKRAYESAFIDGDTFLNRVLEVLEAE